MNVTEFYNKKSVELGWKNIKEFISAWAPKMVEISIADWTKEYAELYHQEKLKQQSDCNNIENIKNDLQDIIKELEKRANVVEENNLVQEGKMEAYSAAFFMCKKLFDKI